MSNEEKVSIARALVVMVNDTPMRVVLFSEEDSEKAEVMALEAQREIQLREYHERHGQKADPRPNSIELGHVWAMRVPFSEFKSQKPSDEG